MFRHVNRSANTRKQGLCPLKFDIAVMQVEPIIDPDSVTDGVWWKSMASVCFHLPILSIQSGYPGSTEGITYTIVSWNRL